jgi:hypothetical protein
MWQEYLIPSTSEMQLRIMRSLKMWMEGLENRNLVSGFAFNLYYNNPPERDELRIRFEYTKEESTSIVENELQSNIRDFISDYTIEKRVWNNGTTPENVLRAYEFGSRCALLLLKLIERGRLRENWVASFYPLSDQSQSLDSFNFQLSANHGLMNSLGIDKCPNELLIHIFSLITVTKSHNLQELIRWLETYQGEFGTFFQYVP